MYAQCDPEGNAYVLFDSIVDYKRDSTAMSKNDQAARKADGRTYMRRSTVGWKLCIQWKDGSTSWERLADLKETHPTEVAEYAVAQDIADAPAFNWWVPHVLKKREAIISLVKQRNARYLKREEEFGIRIPKSVKEAKELDRQNGNTFWQDAIAKEMANVRVAFNILDDDEKVPARHQFVKGHCCTMINLGPETGLIGK